MARSTDGGITWPFKRAIAAEPGWDVFTNHGMTLLSDGSLLLHYIKGQHLKADSGPPLFYARGRFARSTDHGGLWQQHGPQLDYPFISPSGRGFCYGKVHELTDGRLMAPFYGTPKDPQDEDNRVLAMVFSHDNGRTWPDYTLIHQDTQGIICPSETDLIKLDDGRFMALIRANPTQRLYRAYSADEGQSWSPLEPTSMPGQSPALIGLASGAILCAYRDISEDQPGMSCAISVDNGETWKDLGYLYKGANRDCAYPSLVRLPNGHIFCAFYTAVEKTETSENCEIHGLILEDRSLV
jgi:hypothetical protein